MRTPPLDTDNRLRNAALGRSNPTRPRFWGIYGPLAFLAATLREMSYPQFLIFKRYPFFNPPPLGNIYLVTLYLILILVFLFYDSIVSGPMYYETIAYRAAWCSVAQVPLIFLLAMKNSIVGAIIGSSHERLNWLHRTVARCLLLTVTIHFSFFWREWWIYRAIESELQMMTMVKYGFSAWFVLIWIVISSFAPIRNLRYEVFVVQHIISFVALITLLMLHVPSYAVVYIWIPVGFYAFDRTVRTGRLIYRNLSIFHGKRTGLLSCKANLAALPGRATRITIQNPPLRSWRPGQHVFLSIPSISPLQSHPYTIASSPSSTVKELSFIVRSHAGFSRRLYDRATSVLPRTSRPAKENSFTVILDGPYGRPPNFLQFETLILIAGSTGATFIIPILLHALQSTSASCVRRIEFVWIVKAGSNLEWFANEISDALELAKGKDIQLDVKGFVTCDPTYTTNFPVRRAPGQKNCCCFQDEVEEQSSQSADSIDVAKMSENSEPSEDDLVQAEKEIKLSMEKDVISVRTDSSSEAVCPCSCGDGAEESLAEVLYGRPDLRAILDRNLRTARGETGVAVCGPQGLMAMTRTLIAELSDERGADKGTGAYGVTMFGEGFGW